MQQDLRVTLCRDRNGAPLACVNGLPGEGADLSPAQLRALARTLERIAAATESRVTTGKRYMPYAAVFPISTDPA